MSSLVSVIIPIYRVEKYLARCLDSVVNQTYRELEIILVDDKGGDNSLNIAKEYKSRDSRIILIENSENKGAAYSRNAGLARATGKWVSFVDSDDFVALDLYEKVVGRAESVGAQVLQFRIRVCRDVVLEPVERGFSEDCFLIKDHKPTADLVSLYGQLKVNPVNKLYLRAFLRENDIIFDESVRKHEDNVFFVPIVNLCRDFYHFGSLEPSYFYDVGNATSLMKGEVSLEQCLLLVNGLFEAWKKIKHPNFSEKIFMKWIDRQIFWTFYSFIRDGSAKKIDMAKEAVVQKYGARSPFARRFGSMALNFRARMFIKNILIKLNFIKQN